MAKATFGRSSEIFVDEETIPFVCFCHCMTSCLLSGIKSPACGDPSEKLLFDCKKPLYARPLHISLKSESLLICSDTSLLWHCLKQLEPSYFEDELRKPLLLETQSSVPKQLYEDLSL